MKIYQPLAIIGFSFCISLLIASLIPFNYIIAVFVLIAVAFLALFCFFISKGFNLNRIMILSAAVISLIGITVNAYQRFYLTKVAVEFPATTISVTGTVLEEYPSNNNQHSFLVEIEKIENRDVSKKIKTVLYSGKETELFKGEQILCEIKAFKNIPNRSQIGKGAKIAGRIEEGSVKVLEEASLENKFMSNLKFNLKVAIKQSVSSPYDSVLIAMLLGDIDEIDSKMHDSFVLTGISHVLCVSGLHISLIAVFFIGLFSLFFGKRLIADIIGIFACLLFVILTGAKPSAVRAFVMVVTLILTRHIARDYSPINTLGGIVLLFCMIEPEIVYNTGFIMSVFSVFSLCVVARKWNEIIFEKLSIKSGFLMYIISMFIASLTVSVFLMPILLIGTGYTSALAPFANLIILPLVSPVMILGAVCVLFGSSGIGVLAGSMVDFLIDKMVIVADSLGKLPFAILPLNLSFIKIWVFGTAMIVIVAMALKYLKGNIVKIVGFSAILLIVSSTVFFMYNYNDITLTVLENGEGSSFVISKNGKSCVVNCGGSNLIGAKTAQYMRSVAADDFELLLILNNKDKNAGGVSRLVSLIQPKEIIAPLMSNYLSAVYDIKECILTPLSCIEKTVLGDVIIKIEERAVINANGKEIFIDQDGNLGLITDDRELILRKGKKEDTIDPKYDIIDVNTVVEFEKANFKDLNLGQALNIRIAENGNMLIY